MEEKRPLILVIDFDATIVETNSDFSISGIREGAAEVIREWYDRGFYIIINTCRKTNSKTGFAAEEFLWKNRIPYHQFNNQSLFSRRDWGEEVGTKIFGDLYIDDKNLWVQAEQGGNMHKWPSIRDMVELYLHKNHNKNFLDYEKE